MSKKWTPRWKSAQVSAPKGKNEYYLVTMTMGVPYTDISLFDGKQWCDNGVTHWMGFPSITHDGWNDATTNPPKKNDTYIVVLDGELVGQKKPFVSICGFCSGEWDDWGVLQWMPLPEPAKQQPEDTNKEAPKSIAEDTPVNTVKDAPKDATISMAKYEALRKEYDELKILWDMYGGEEGITAAFQKAALLDKAMERVQGKCAFCVHSDTLCKVKSPQFKAHCLKCIHFGKVGAEEEDHWEWNNRLPTI